MWCGGERYVQCGVMERGEWHLFLGLIKIVNHVIEKLYCLFHCIGYKGGRLPRGLVYKTAKHAEIFIIYFSHHAYDICRVAE